MWIYYLLTMYYVCGIISKRRRIFMKECPKCKTKYNDYDQYCLKCNYKLQFIQNSEIVDYSPNSNLIDKPQSQQSNKPKCPICQSTNLSKITTVQKAGKIALFGIFGMGDNGKTWKCNNCGSKF